MMHLSGKWQAIMSDDKTLLTYMGIFTPAGDDSWEESAGYFQTIDTVIRKLNVQDIADVSLNARVLTVAFHMPNTQKVPGNVLAAADELTMQLTAAS